MVTDEAINAALAGQTDAEKHLRAALDLLSRYLSLNHGCGCCSNIQQQKEVREFYSDAYQFIKEND